MDHWDGHQSHACVYTAFTFYVPSKGQLKSVWVSQEWNLRKVLEILSDHTTCWVQKSLHHSTTTLARRLRQAYKREVEGDLTTETEKEKVVWWWSKDRSEDGGRSHKPRNTSNAALEAGKGKETNSPLEPPGGAWPCRHFNPTQWNRFWTFDSKNCKIINTCCFMPPSL